MKKETLVPFLAYNGLALNMKDEISVLLNNKGISIEEQVALWSEASDYLQKNPLKIPDAPETLLEDPQLQTAFEKYLDTQFDNIPRI